MTELPNNLETILHIGAGHGEELPAYLESDAKRILLVEPNPNLAEPLRRRAQNDERVQVLELAITDDVALNQLNEYNLPEAASLYRPTGLRQIFPGLRITAQHPVATKTPEEMLDQYPLVGDNNLLVIQAPGAEFAIVNALDNANKLGAISHIQLTLPAEVYYEGGHRADDILQALTRRGYDTEHTSTENPDWPDYHLACNPLARRLQDVDLEKQSLVQALQQSKNEKQYIQATLETAKQELTDARKEFDQKQQAWQKQKQELTTRLEGAMQHSSEADRTVENLQSRETELGAALNQSNAMVRQLREQLDAVQAEAETLKVGMEEVKEEARKAASIAEDEKTKLAERHQQAEQAQKQAEEELQQHKKSLNSRKQELTAKTDELEKQKIRFESLEQENAHLKDQVQQLQSQLSARTKEGEELTKKLESEQQAHEKALEAVNDKLSAEQKAHAETREELQKHKTYLANRKQQLSETEQKLEQLGQQLKEQSASSQRFDQLEAKLAGITRNITGHMDKQLHSTSQQLESSIALQGYLQGGQLPMKPAGPSLSANMALYMAEQIETGQYDLIIEFGSGASTGFLARTVLKRLANSNGDTQRLGYQQGKEAGGKELAFISPDEDDLPKRIISFEHRKEQSAKIEQSLTAAGLQHVVELVHAPLVDYQHQDHHFLHYGCEKTLERLASLYEGRTAKFLVLVNGPPSKTGPMARFPALPKLLNTLGIHKMDIVFGDSVGDDANTLTERWCGLLEQRGISFRKEVIHNEKAATRLAINHA